MPQTLYKGARGGSNNDSLQIVSYQRQMVALTKLVPRPFHRAHACRARSQQQQSLCEICGVSREPRLHQVELRYVTGIAGSMLIICN
jgi:hypothetical protein